MARIAAFDLAVCDLRHSRDEPFVRLRMAPGSKNNLSGAIAQSRLGQLSGNAEKLLSSRAADFTFDGRRTEQCTQARAGF
jgi:hypothetical protein